MPSPRKFQTTLSIFALCLAAAVAAPAQTFTLLDSLNGTTIGGGNNAPLIQGVDGNLYGVGLGGYRQDGTIFRLTPEGTLSLFHYFHFVDGKNPNGLVLETNGNLFGTAGGGTNTGCAFNAGCGTVFGFTSAGTLFTVYDFNASGPIGENLTLGPDGSTFYGTGVGWSTSTEFGTIFKITPTGTITPLLNLDSSSYGPGPLVLGTNGNLYGTTTFEELIGDGTVFEITPEGTLTTLHTFNGGDGSSPAGALVEGTDGNFYGTTTYGGSHNNGTVFVISPGGRIFQTLHNFTGGSDGGTPATGLVLGSDGNFYGTTSGDGQDNFYGTVFEITPAGTLTTLHTFDGTDGFLFPTLTQHTNGVFYGTTGGGGSEDNGIAFSLSTGLGPFVTAVPAYRGIGAKVLLLGQGFTGATSVTFNGVSATFTVNSDTEITTTVPVGATKGYIVVTTPTGTVSTKVFFTVG